MKNETIKNLAGVVLLYLVLIIGVIAINARIEQTQDINPVVSLQK